jgi:hypothetical protein
MSMLNLWQKIQNEKDVSTFLLNSFVPLQLSIFSLLHEFPSSIQLST